ncbi:tRNA (cytosine(38)-C(5))-methyltransferase isoform X1 [Ornithorhynchus anatinus]|uniref:tRNA (cytosine(38)-C(5))-methyltransferase isoform X1 n=1 Tax=Ornithorhynchus anatinus TaxID=9258 RepID=UPI0010A8646B|nr:tRNA (cytosine(38)-C(5))-methyltransferase isoform X1 [Ornithorhynchus anatinus]
MNQMPDPSSERRFGPRLGVSEGAFPHPGTSPTPTAVSVNRTRDRTALFPAVPGREAPCVRPPPPPSRRNLTFPSFSGVAAAQGISLQEFDRLSFDVMLMSPPCQPFTRTGLRGDAADGRTKSFLYLLRILPRLRKPPRYILLENVKGFEGSATRDLLVQTIEKCGFQYQEFLLSPTSLGIPNSRLRYFLIAKLQSSPFPFQVRGQILTEFPEPGSGNSPRREVAVAGGSERAAEPGKEENTEPRCRSADGTPRPGREAVLFKLETAEEMQRKRQRDGDLSVEMLRGFLEEDSGPSRYFLPPKPLLRYGLLLDVVKPTCRRSTCFTKGYGSYVEGTGSVLQTAEEVQIEDVYEALETLPEEEKLRKLATLKLRYFTPREIANLHGFPPEFGFPEQISTKQRYRLLGNSLNVLVVAKLIAILLGSSGNDSG